MASLSEALNAALDHQEAGRLDQAETLYRRILAAVPEQPDALHLWGLVAAMRGDLAAALDRIDRAIANRSGVADYHGNRSRVLAATGRLGEAADEALRAADLDPDSADRRFHAAGLLQDLGRLDEAAENYGVLARRLPDAAPVHMNLALLREAQGDGTAAHASYLRVLALDPAHARAWSGLSALGSPLGPASGPAGEPGAVVAQRRAVLSGAEGAEPVARLALLRKEAGDLSGADRANRAALALDPVGAGTWNEQGNLEKGLRRLAASSAAYGRALVLRPDNAILLNNRADSLLKDGALAAAEADARRAVAADGRLSAAWNTLGTVLHRQNRLEDALDSFTRACDTASDGGIQARFNRSVILLALGRFAEGWDDYELGWCLDSGGRERSRPFPQPRWDGLPLSAGTLLVWGEQGLGDEVMYAALLPQLAADGMRVVLECDERLAALFRRGMPAVEVVPRRDPPAPRLTAPDITAQCPAGSLPRFMRRSSQAFAQSRPSCLAAAPLRTAALSDGLPAGRRRVGIAWSSKNDTLGRERSIPLALLARAMNRPDVTLVSLQYGDVAGEVAAAGTPIHLEPGIDAWSDIDGLAALISAMDLVVTIDNSTAHLAAALGRPTWILLPYAADWRWTAGRDDSLWYPSARLFRQTVAGDWSYPLAAAGTALDRWRAELAAKSGA
ncbi:tetratricopeptide repeat protein [Azospirillum picis]|uniref:Tetratricopeptide (TPR) repeat protein n=1 Tax=Azospirillum picis TaxID=488438 RepID=A0ABU0MG45_9PROT|nr:tetratricopeptide repeat protein [Azospirillum picis]MBP2298550.1 tetratricopeptide (TPR) repeat protein [Azospirillum picis]MDQ0532401.1 tetratricopeptide (TPR) repeat protein [Azospirillum picis]